MAGAKFITLEGGEGAGKSTQLRLLVAALQAKSIACVQTREPGGSPGGEEIRELLVKGEPGRWDALTEALLMFAARTDHVARTIKPALDAGKWVVCDRFTDSTYAYQGAGRGLGKERIAAMEAATLGGLKPDLTLVLDLPAEMGLKRTLSRPGSDTRFEKFDLGFHEKLRTAFLEIAKREPSRCIVVDTARDVETVAADIWRIVSSRFGIT
ncbi:MAG: dTMP kinase [Proteobacteria bacterium]|nr:dTMP kinase [Pseudomonadota bacterium]